MCLKTFIREKFKVLLQRNRSPKLLLQNREAYTSNIQVRCPRNQTLSKVLGACMQVLKEFLDEGKGLVGAHVTYYSF